MVEQANPLFGATLRVAFVVGVTPGKWAKVWAERLPRTYLELLPATQAAALAAIMRGEVDAVLVRLPVPDERLSSIPLYVERPVVVAPKGHPIEAADSVVAAELVAENVIGADEQDGDWARVVELVATGVGVAVMPQSVARALGRRDVIARPVTDGPETRIALVWRPGDESVLVEEFIGIVRGRTANSSRGQRQQPAPHKPAASRQSTPDRRPSRRR